MPLKRGKDDGDDEKDEAEQELHATDDQLSLRQKVLSGEQQILG